MRRERFWLLSLLGAWAAATGLIMILDARILGSEQAWQPAQFGGHVPLALYGSVYLAIAAPVLSAAASFRWRTAGLAATLAAAFVSIFLSLCLVLEADQSGIGWVGAVNFVFDATMFVLANRFLSAAASTGRA